MYSFEKPPSYKANPHKPTTTRSLTAAICRPFVNFGRYFCLKTSIHGLRHIAEPKRHWCERLLWAITIFAATWFVISVSLGQLNRYYESPTVVTLEKDFRTWKFSVPGVTSCLEDKVNPKKAPQVIKKFWGVDSSSPKYERYMKFVKTVANSDILNLEGYKEFMGDPDLEVDLQKLAQEVASDTEIKTLSSQDSLFKWTQVMTEFGICITTNSVAILDIALEQVNTNITKGYPVKCQYSAQTCFLLISTTNAAKFYIHSPFDIVDVTTNPNIGVSSNLINSELTVQETGSGKGVRELSKSRRGCYYTDEPDIKGRKIYSIVSCRLNCRSRLSLQLCGCRPFYYFYEDGPVCTPSGMACLADYREELAAIEGIQCICPTQCIYSTFQVVHVVTEFATPGGPFLSGSSMKYMVLPPRTRYTREILFSFQDLIVSFGGAAGLFLGASFISLVEFVYFILLKLVGCITSAEHQEEDHTSVGKKKTEISLEEMRVQELTRMLEDTYYYGDHGQLIEDQRFY